MVTDSPKIFNLDAVKDEAAREPFRFTYKGARYQLPHFADLDVLDTFASIGESGDVIGMYRIFIKELGEKHAAAIRQAGMKAAHFNGLLEAWQKHAGVTPGESSASTGS